MCYHFNYFWLINEIIQSCRLKLLMYLLIQRTKMRFLKVNSLTQDRLFWVFVKGIIISMIPYAELNTLQWWSFTISTTQLLLHLWQLAIFVILILKLVKAGVVKFVLIMMYVMLVIRRIMVRNILISWPIIHPWLIAMLKIKKLDNYEFYRYFLYIYNLSLIWEKSVQDRSRQHHAPFCRNLSWTVPDKILPDKRMTIYIYIYTLISLSKYVYYLFIAVTSPLFYSSGLSIMQASIAKRIMFWREWGVRITWQPKWSFIFIYGKDVKSKLALFEANTSRCSKKKNIALLYANDQGYDSSRPEDTSIWTFSAKY